MPTTRRKTRSSDKPKTRQNRTRQSKKKEKTQKPKKEESKITTKTQQKQDTKSTLRIRAKRKTKSEKQDEEKASRTRVHKPATVSRKPLSDEKKKELDKRLARKRKAHEAELETKKKGKTKRPRVKEIEYNWSGWKDIYLVGTEWHLYDEVFKYDWDFDHLEEMLEERDFETGKNVYMFGATEPQLVYPTKNAKEQKVIPIPVIVAVVSSMPPPSKLGVNSVQMEEGEVIPMSSMKISWVPFEPRHSPKKKDEAMSTDIYYLHCSRRRSALRRLKPDEIKKYEYCMPYIMQLKDDEIDTDTSVNIIRNIGGRGLSFEFDWEMDTLDDTVQELAEAENLSKKQQEEVRDIIRSEVREAKKAKKEAKKKKQEEINALSAAEKEALKSMRLIKFYPQNDEPVISNQISKYINRYYGSAHQVYPKPDQ